MKTYWNGVEDKDNLPRGIFLILPIRRNAEKLPLAETLPKPTVKELKYISSDFTELLLKKCKDKNFVKRSEIEVEKVDDEQSIFARISNLQLFEFGNGIHFLTVYIPYLNAETREIYTFLNPGYVDESSGVKDEQSLFLNWIDDHILTPLQFSWLYDDEDAKQFILKEAYRMNIASAPKRFETIDMAEKTAYNLHRIIRIDEDFEDPSENDVKYTTGARDVEDKLYGWGCAITSQEISYVYGPKHGKTTPLNADDLLGRAMEDLLLTILVMYQRYTCIRLNDKIHNKYASEDAKFSDDSDVWELKREALEFVTYGTIAPTQISRWSNVCETYRHLQDVVGNNEALEEIEKKITMLNDEQSRIEDKREKIVATIITIFGLISIVASILQIADYYVAGNPFVLASLKLSVVGVVALGAILLGWLKYDKKRKGNL